MNEERKQIAYRVAGVVLCVVGIIFSFLAQDAARLSESSPFYSWSHGLVIGYTVVTIVALVLDVIFMVVVIINSEKKNFIIVQQKETIEKSDKRIRELEQELIALKKR